MPRRLIFATPGHLVRAGARQAREQVFVEIARRRGRSRWWQFESELVATVGGHPSLRPPRPVKTARSNK